MDRFFRARVATAIGRERQREKDRQREASRAHLLLDREQVEARDHVREVRVLTGAHDVDACPPLSLATCPHKRVIERMRPEDFE